MEDPLQNDEYLYKEGESLYAGGQFIGTPLAFTYGNFTFAGLIKSSDQINDPTTGNPIFKLVLVSPHEVLDATQVILADYIGVTSDTIFNSTPQGTNTFQVSNLINVFGWAEDGGLAFGRSLSTETGMPWGGNFGIGAGIQHLTNIPNAGPTTTNWGSYLVYRGHTYRVDVSNFPTPPDFYRFGGVINITLSDLINKFMEDAGNDYMVKLTLNPNSQNGPHTISFILVPHYIQQQLGQIPDYIQSQSNIATVTRGQELRSDITQAMLVGGSIEFLQQIFNNSLDLAIIPFFGFDVNGFPIVGKKIDGTQFADDDYSMNLNASSIADIMGALAFGTFVFPYNTEIGDTYIPQFSYPSCILELRCALGGFDTWAVYISVFQPALGKFLNLSGGFDATNPGGAQTIVNLLNDARGFATRIGKRFQSNYWVAVVQRLYEFVRGQAETYYGKQFIVKLPFAVQVKIDPNTFETSFNDELTDSGFAVEGTNVLGLNFVNENFFLDENSKFVPFVSMNYTSNFNSINCLFPGGNINAPPLPPKQVDANIAYITNPDSVVQWQLNVSPDPTQPTVNNTQIFTKVQQGLSSPVSVGGQFGGGQIFFVTNGIGVTVPAIVISIADAIWTQPEDVLGSTLDLSAMMSLPPSFTGPISAGPTKFPITQAALQNLLRRISTAGDLAIRPPAIYPNAAAIAIKSNQYVYGPWGQFSADGKLEFEQDDSLVPWQYGSYDQMNKAAIAKLNTIAKGNQVLERGNWTEAGLPKISIGETLAGSVGNTPLLTSISCEIGVGGVTTNYVMETFVNRAGAFIYENQLRLQAVGKAYQQMRRTTRQLILSQNQGINLAQTAYRGFFFGATYALQGRTPHGCLGSNLTLTDSGTYVPQVFAQTYQESLTGLNVDDFGDYDNDVVAIGLEALFRPYTYDLNNDLLSAYIGPDSGYNTFGLVASTGNINLNPMKDGCDLTWVLSGQQYDGMRTDNTQGVYKVDWGTARGIALKGPVVIQGWGYDLTGQPVPNNGHLLHGLYPNPYNKLQDQTNEFYSDPINAPKGANYLNQSVYWPTGPLDIRWNKFTGTWISPGMVLRGEVSGNDLRPGSFSEAVVYVAGRWTNEHVTVHNHFICGSPVPTGTRIIMGYDPLGNNLVLISADCCNI